MSVGRREIGLYVHIPFCAARCPYCDFATAPATTALRARYLVALVTEIEREGAAARGTLVRTLYVGGGTPSLLEPEEIRQVGEAIARSFALDLREASMEANPATLDRTRLEAWRAFGIDRLSLGVQSFSARGLAALGRTHQPGDVAPAVAAARSIGMDVSLDLMFGWPEQSEAGWRADLAAAVALAPDHISAYPLELRLDDPEEAVANWPGGGWPVLQRWRADSAAAQPDDDGIARLYEIAERDLECAGFRHYEIANWAMPKKRCLHNLRYWRNDEWIGVGAGAHSHRSLVRSRNPASLTEYLARIERGAGRIVDERSDPAIDGAMLGLRLDEGLDLDAYAGRFGVAAASRVRDALRGLDGSAGAGARLLSWDGPRLRLTARGRLLASEVFVRLLPDEPHGAGRTASEDETTRRG